MNRRRRTALLIFVVFLGSCLLGPALDQIHVMSGALSYADPWLFDQAWWVGPQFGLAFAALAGASLAIQCWLGSRSPDPSPPVRILQQGAWLLVAYLTTGLLWGEPWMLAAVLAAALAVRAAAERPDAATVRTVVLLALAGSTYEAVLSSIPGTFRYAETAGLPVPPWLPLLYAHAGPLVRTFMTNATAKLGRRAA